jgi:hypothetical protein
VKQPPALGGHRSLCWVHWVFLQITMLQRHVWHC